jgi:hypothetical protein
MNSKLTLRAGGNPQITKAYGDAPVQAFIAAMPGWKSGVGHRLDTLTTRAVPGVRKAVKYNSPLFGIKICRRAPESRAHSCLPLRGVFTVLPLSGGLYPAASILSARNSASSPTNDSWPDLNVCIQCNPRK